MNRASRIRFQRARVSDEDALLRMMRALEEEDPSGVLFDEPAKRRAFRILLRRKEMGCVWLVWHGDQPVGYVILALSFSFEFHGLDAFVDELYVAPAYRRQGIGKQAMDLVEDNCTKLGVKALHLEVSRGNAPAIELYRRTGFEDHDRYLMTKWLPKKAIPDNRGKVSP